MQTAYGHSLIPIPTLTSAAETFRDRVPVAEPIFPGFPGPGWPDTKEFRPGPGWPDTKEFRLRNSAQLPELCAEFERRLGPLEALAIDASEYRFAITCQRFYLIVDLSLGSDAKPFNIGVYTSTDKCLLPRRTVSFDEAIKLVDAFCAGLALR